MTTLTAFLNRFDFSNKITYFSFASVVVLIWTSIYMHIIPFSKWFTYDILNIGIATRLGDAVEFFVYDSLKILLLLVLLVYALAWVRAGLNIEYVRDYLASKARILGYFLGASFGAVTPFCSCSSIPLFLGFSTARIPLGITMAFLITSPLINEVAVIMLWGLLGWEFTIYYVSVGILSGIIGGIVMDLLNAQRWLKPFLRKALENQQTNAPQACACSSTQTQTTSFLGRHEFAKEEAISIFKKVWIWVVIGVGLGAGLHGFVPQEWFEQNLSSGELWSVPAAVLVGIPLYSNVTGVIPIMESLLGKGLPIGTTLAFCMSTVAASLPEILMLKQVMEWKLLALFITILLIIFTFIGYFFNFLQTYNII